MTYLIIIEKKVKKRVPSPPPKAHKAPPKSPPRSPPRPKAESPEPKREASPEPEHKRPTSVTFKKELEGADWMMHVAKRLRLANYMNVIAAYWLII